MHTGFGLVAFVIVSAGVSMVAVRMAAAANRDKRDTRQLWLAVGFGGNLAMIAIQAALIRYHLPDPFAHAYAAANLALVCYGLMQAFVGGLLCAAAFFRARSGLVSASRAAPITIARLWQDFTLLIAILSSILLAVIPMLVEKVPLP